MSGIGHHRLSPHCFHGLCDFLFGAGDDDGADTRFHGAAPHMHYHGLAVNIRQYFPGKPGGGEARGDNDDGILR